MRGLWKEILVSLAPWLIALAVAACGCAVLAFLGYGPAASWFQVPQDTAEVSE